MTISLTNLAATTEADAFARLLDSGKLKIYSSTVPATADTALGAQVLLGTLPLSATSAPGASNGVLTFNAITDDSSADATGTATFYRLTKSDDTVVAQGSVGTSGENLNLNSVAIQIGATISVTSFTHTVTK